MTAHYLSALGKNDQDTQKDMCEGDLESVSAQLLSFS